MDPAIRLATLSDAPAIAAIYNQGIAGRAATFETTPRSTADVEGWFQNADRYPTLVVEQGGAVAGWANLRAWRSAGAVAFAKSASTKSTDASMGSGSTSSSSSA
jgi:phosphinothricin acetyltransferase